MRDGFIKVAAGTPQIRVADCRYNAESCFTLMREAHRQGVRVLVLPELCLTGATCGDLFRQDTLLRGAREALATVLEATSSLDMVTALGLPLLVDSKLYFCTAIIQKGVILGVVPGEEVPEHITIQLCGAPVPFSSRLVFPCDSLPGLTLAVEPGARLLSPQPPSALLASAGATLLLSPYAAGERVGGAERRRSLVLAQSARLCCGYVCAGAGEGESTTDQVYAGHNLIAENGVLLEESRSFGSGLLLSELDVQRLAAQRLAADFPVRREDTMAVPFPLEPSTTLLTRAVSPTPFVPQDPRERLRRCDEVLVIAAVGLKKRLEHTGAKCAVVGLSGGLDSTLAILIAAMAMRLLDRPASDVVAVTMPCFGTTDRTRDNAVLLAGRLGATLRRVDISDTVRSHFRDIGQSLDSHDVTFENAQARERTQVIMDIANQLDGLVVGTGDLSELALGWATYNGDHMSMYGVNAAIPKTLVRHLVDYVCHDKEGEDAALSGVLADILDTPVSPELLPAVNGQIAQRTEDLVGPYELHDFFLYYAVRWGFSPRKILRLAEHAFGRAYDRATILKWERVFFRRFFSQQFKRSCLPDGPAVGSVGLSPRGAWSMPSDAVAALWLEDLEAVGE